MQFYFRGVDVMQHEHDKAHLSQLVDVFEAKGFAEFALRLGSEILEGGIHEREAKRPLLIVEADAVGEGSVVASGRRYTMQLSWSTMPFNTRSWRQFDVGVCPRPSH